MKKGFFIVLFAIIVSFLLAAPAEAGEAATVKLNASKKTIYAGQTFQLKLNGASGSVVWKSSDSSIATVDGSGLVAGVKKGTAKITAKYKGKTYKCTVKVKALSAAKIKKQALAAAKEVGLSNADLRGKYSLFLRFADQVAKNPELHEYRGYVYSIFPIVADHLKAENEEFFFNKLGTLKMTTSRNKDFAAAFWAEENRIEIATGLDAGYDTEAQFATTMYHELIHFIDSNIDGEGSVLYRLKDGSFVKSASCSEELEADGAEIVGGDYWVEGGAEKYMAEYFTYAPEAGAYLVGEQFLTGMDYIFGKEKVDGLFFSNDTDYRFVELLKKNGFSNKEINGLFKVMKKMLDREEQYPVEEYTDPQEALIRLYIKNVGPDYEKDAAFCRILANMQDPVLQGIPSKYRSFTSQLHRFSFDDELELGREVARLMNYGDAQLRFVMTPTPLFVDGSLKLVGMFRIETGEDTYQCRTAVMDYDFATDTVIKCKVYGDWVPKDLSRKLPSEDSKEAKALLKELTLDNSAAHNQTRSGSDPWLKEQYRSALNIGNKYGVYICFADMIPDGALFNADTAAADPELISRALKQIDNVLALYPEDYFDRMAFEFYSGVYIILYDGWYEYAFPDSIRVDGKYYLALYVDVSIDRVQGHFGEDVIHKKYFSKVNPIASELVCDIFCLSEKLLGVKNEHFENPRFSDADWQALNYKGFAYPASENAKELKRLEKKAKMKYFLCRESLSSAKTDRLLLAQYLMLSSLTGSKQTALTDECRAKAQVLEEMYGLRLIR